MDGVAGTAMPSFKVLPENEVDALVHYVRYLAIRGEVERNLMMYIATELDPDQRLLDLSAGPEVQAGQIETLHSFVADVVEKWLQAEESVTEVPAPDPQRDLAASVARGRELFYGTAANCMTCHGDSQLGDGQTNGFDDWTKELNPENPEAVEDFLAIGAFPPRNILPRNLRLGVYRGGRRPIDLYWRIHNGIDGTTMPGVDKMLQSQALTQEDVWCLIDYVRSLPYDELSQPALPEYLRERM
jgi:mono/diheme cytochrome c family protein